MRIVLLLTETFRSHGGMQAYNRALCMAASDLVAERGGRIEVLSLNDRTEDLDARYLPQPHGRFRGFAGSEVRFSLAALRASVRADWAVLGHANLLPLAPLLRAVGLRRLGCCLHGVEAWQRWQPTLRLGAHWCSEFLSVSDFTRRKVIAANALAAPIHLFPDTLDPFWPVPESPGELPLEPRLLTVARLDALERYKGVDTTLEALPPLVAHFPGLKYWIAGDGTDRPRLEALARTLGVGGHARFLGRVSAEELRRRYSDCSLFVMPSEGEGFGIVYLEAAAHRKASVGAAGGAVAEVIADGRSGRLVPYGDPAALAAAIGELLSEPGRLGAMGQAAYDDLQTRFAYPAFRARFAQLAGSQPR